VVVHSSSSSVDAVIDMQHLVLLHAAYHF
jgi:hypothetical protein